MQKSPGGIAAGATAFLGLPENGSRDTLATNEAPAFHETPAQVRRRIGYSCQEGKLKTFKDEFTLKKRKKNCYVDF